MKEKVSIIIPTCDRPEFLVRAAVSAIEAVPPGGEVIVIDDGKISAANTLANIEGPVKIMQSVGSGVSAARNTGLRATNGSVIFFLDDDDKILPTYCSHIMGVLSKHPVDFGHSACLRILRTANGVRELRPLTRAMSGGVIARETPFKNQTFGFGAGFWITRQAYEKVGSLDETLPMNEDTEYHCRVLRANLNGWYSDQPGVCLTSHPVQSKRNMVQSADRHSARVRADCFQRIVDLHLAELSDIPGASNFLLTRLVKHLTRSGQKQRARTIISDSPPVQWPRLIMTYMGNSKKGASVSSAF